MKRWLTILAVTAFALYHFSNNDADVDLWGNVGFVDSLPWQEGFNWSNTYSYTEPDHEWINHEWMGQYILNRTFHLAGNPGLLTLKLILGFAVLGFIAISMRKDKSFNAAGFLYLILIISTMGYGYSTRPHHFTYLLYAFMLWLLFKSNARPLLIPALTLPVTVLWANLHGAFFIGAILLAAVSASESFQLLLPGGKTRVPGAQNRSIALFASLLVFLSASLINPYGFHLWNFIFKSGAVMRPYLSEWAPLNPVKDFHAHIDFLALVIITFACLAASRQRTRITEIAVLTLAAIAAFLMRRNIPLFAITAGILCFRHVSSIASEPITSLSRRIHPAAISLFLATFSVLSISYALTFKKTAPLEIEIDRDKFPVRAIQFVNNNDISGNMLIFFDWAQYAIWRLYPETKVFTDGRFLSAYSARTIKDYHAFIYAQKNWKDALEKYPTEIVFIHTGNPAYEKMQNLTEWDMVYRDHLAAVFTKNRHIHKFSAEQHKTGVSNAHIFP